jgi:hypothetical protein
MHWMPGHEGIHCLPRRLVPPEDCPTQDELRREWQPAADEEYAELCVQQDRYDAWSALPLIVLAGLR